MKINFLQEIINILEEYGKTFDDIIWIGTKDWIVTPSHFQTLCNFEYEIDCINFDYEIAGFKGIFSYNFNLIGEDFWINIYKSPLSGSGHDFYKYPVIEKQKRLKPLEFYKELNLRENKEA